MPKLITKDFKDTPLYFNLKRNPGDPQEGFWAKPLFQSDVDRLNRERLQRGDLGAPDWVEHLAWAVTGWVGFVDIKGEEIPHSPEAVRQHTYYHLLLNAARMAVLDAEKN